MAENLRRPRVTQIPARGRLAAVCDTGVHGIQRGRRTLFNRPAANETVAERIRSGHPAALIAWRSVITLVAQAILQQFASASGALFLCVVRVFHTLVEQAFRRLAAMLFAIRRAAAIILKAVVKETTSL